MHLRTKVSIYKHQQLQGSDMPWGQMINNKWMPVFPKIDFNGMWIFFHDFNLYHSLGIFSRPQIDDIFPRKMDMRFPTNCLQWRQFATVKSCFLVKKIRKIVQYGMLRINYVY